ncbi:unnamed protein product [Phaeothamnion confervicola]
MVAKTEKTHRRRTDSEANVEALAAGGVGAIRRTYEGANVVYERRYELGFDFSERCNSYTLKDNAIGIFTEFFCTMLFLFFNIAQLTFLRQGDVAEVTAGNLDSSSRLIIAMQFGVSIFVLVYFAAGISGAHINPAVTWGMLVGNRISVVRGLFYIGAQIAGATVGTGFAKALNPDGYDKAGGGANGLGAGVTQGQGLLAEIAGTMLLVLVVFTATNGYLGTKLAHIPAMLPWSIGMAVFIAHLSLIPITGCSINPARSFGPALVTGDWANQWIFWVGPLIGATIATLLFELVFRLPEPRDRDNVADPPASSSAASNRSAVASAAYTDGGTRNSDGGSPSVAAAAAAATSFNARPSLLKGIDEDGSPA